MNRRPTTMRRRIALSLSLILLAPLATATITVCIVTAMAQFAPTMLTQAGFLGPYICGALLGAAGASAAALMLPIRYWYRIASAAVCVFVVFLTFPFFLALVNYVLLAILGNSAFAEHMS